MTSRAEAGAVHQHQRPRAGSGHGAAALGQPEPLLSLLTLPQAQPESPDAVGLECQSVWEAGRRRRRAQTGSFGPAAAFPAQRTLPGPQASGASGAPQPRTLRPLHSLFHSKAQVAASPGRFWTIPDLAAHRRVSWLPPHRQHTALISPQASCPFNFFILAPSSQALLFPLSFVLHFRDACCGQHSFVRCVLA